MTASSHVKTCARGREGGATRVATPAERAGRGRTFHPAAMISCCRREMQSAMSSLAGKSQHGELGAAGSGRFPSHSITLLIPQRSCRVWSFQPFSGTRWYRTGATGRSAGLAT